MDGGQKDLWLRLEYENGDRRTAPLSGPVYVIGRRSTCNLVLRDPEVSRHHAAIERRGSRVLLRDLGSKNGTSVDGKPVDGCVELTGSERIRIGGTSIRVGGFAPLVSETVLRPAFASLAR